MECLEFTEEEIKTFHQTIAKNIKKIRKIQKITKLDLALTIEHKSMSIIGKIEAGLENKHYNVEQLYKILKTLDIDIYELLKNKTTDSYYYQWFCD